VVTAPLVNAAAFTCTGAQGVSDVSQAASELGELP
jgi:hypothetical protein